MTLLRSSCVLLPKSSTLLPTPYCHGMVEHPSAAVERKRINENPNCQPYNPLELHLIFRLAYTIGSALGSIPPSTESCLSAFSTPNSARLTAGARAWSKHSHRSNSTVDSVEGEESRKKSDGWWGTPSGPVAIINDNALTLFWKVMHGATWRNLHWLPHNILVYEARVAEGYGMRWSQDQSSANGEDFSVYHPWKFRGFVEPMMENGHEVGWRH